MPQAAWADLGGVHVRVCVCGGGGCVCTMPQKTLALAVAHHPPSQGPEPPIPLRQASCRMHPGGLHLHAKTTTTWEMGDGGSKGIGGWARVGVVDLVVGRGNVLTTTTRRTRGVLEFWSLVGSARTQPGAHWHLRVLFNPSLSLTLTVTNKLTMHIAGFFDIV